MYERPDPRLLPLTKMLGLPARATVTDIVSAVQSLQRDNRTVRESSAKFAEAHYRESNKVHDLTERLRQNEELLQIAYETSNRSEAERAKAVLQAAEREDHLRRALNPHNWRATFTGDDSTSGTLFTCLTHGNLVTIEGTGQVLFHYHPCCTDLACKCEKLDEHGHCSCHTYPAHS